MRRTSLSQTDIPHSEDNLGDEEFITNSTTLRRQSRR